MLWGSKLGHAQTYLGVQWLRLHTSIARDMGSVPSWGTKIPHAMWQKNKAKPKLRYVQHRLGCPLIRLIEEDP